MHDGNECIVRESIVYRNFWTKGRRNPSATWLLYHSRILLFNCQNVRGRSLCLCADILVPKHSNYDILSHRNHPEWMNESKRHSALCYCSVVTALSFWIEFMFTSHHMPNIRIFAWNVRISSQRCWWTFVEYVLVQNSILIRQWLWQSAY